MERSRFCVRSGEAMSVTVSEPFDLRALLATMKSAKEKGVNMNIWDRDIKAVEDAIATFDALRAPQGVRLHGKRRPPQLPSDVGEQSKP